MCSRSASGLTFSPIPRDISVDLRPLDLLSPICLVIGVFAIGRLTCVLLICLDIRLFDIGLWLMFCPTRLDIRVLVIGLLTSVLSNMARNPYVRYRPLG
jgi:hypothetical protein